MSNTISSALLKVNLLKVYLSVLNAISTYLWMKTSRKNRFKEVKLSSQKENTLLREQLITPRNLRILGLYTGKEGRSSNSLLKICLL